MLLTEEFLKPYKEKGNPFPNPLGEFVYYRTYSRFKEEEGRRERWWETVRRVVEYNCSLDPDTTTREAEKMFDYIYNLKLFPSGRTLWVGGEQVSKEVKTANFNCAFTVIDNLDAFYDTFYLLMVGAGVGARILKSDIEKLPRLRSNFEVEMKPYEPVPKEERIEHTFVTNMGDTWHIVVGDSKVGWCNALYNFLQILAKDKGEEPITIKFDFDNVRPKGEILRTFGGYASGHESLQTMFEKISKVVQESGTGRLRPIHCLDILCIIGENVVAGGTRRTSIITLIDEDDTECIQAKNGLYDSQGRLNKAISHRRTSNNSILYFKKPSSEQLKWQIEQMRYTGEPAFVNMVAGKRRRPSMEGVNPCVTGDTLILTKEGYERIDSLVDEPTIVWNGYEWSETIPKVTGENQEIMTLTFSDGVELNCTPYHKFILKDGSRVEAKNLTVDDKLMKHNFPIIEGTLPLICEKEMYTRGFYCGDGTTGFKRITLYNDKVKLLPHLSYKSTGQVKDEKLNITLNKVYEKGYVPSADIQVENRLQFLAGLLDSDGTVSSHDGGVSVSSTDKDFLMKVKLMLNTLGVSGHIHLMRDKGFREMPDGKGGSKEYFCKKTYRLTISAMNTVRLVELGLKTHRVSLDFNPNRDASRFIKINSISRSGEVADKVYCFNEPINHSGVFNGVMTAQCAEILLRDKEMCNLTTVNVMGFVEDGKLDWEGLMEAQELSAKMALRMATLDLELEGWNDKSETITGCSLTGWEDAMNALEYDTLSRNMLYDDLRERAHDVMYCYSLALNIPEPKLVTTLKPEGTISLLPTVSSGMHFSHAPYYIRRVRISRDNPLSKAIREMGFPVELDKADSNLDVVSFPVKAPEGKTKYDVSALEQLKLYKLVMQNYVDFNASNTIHVRHNEWEDVENWMYENWDAVVAVSFLPLDDSVYPQMPLEAITEEQYNKMVKELPKFDPDLITKFEVDPTDFDVDVDSECGSGLCPIK